MRQQVLILRQVDDFAVASEDEQLAINLNLIEDINTRMTIMRLTSPKQILKKSE